MKFIGEKACSCWIVEFVLRKFFVIGFDEPIVIFIGTATNFGNAES